MSVSQQPQETQAQLHSALPLQITLGQIAHSHKAASWLLPFLMPLRPICGCQASWKAGKQPSKHLQDQDPGISWLQVKGL